MRCWHLEGDSCLPLPLPHPSLQGPCCWTLTVTCPWVLSVLLWWHLQPLFLAELWDSTETRQGTRHQHQLGILAPLMPVLSISCSRGRVCGGVRILLELTRGNFASLVLGWGPVVAPGLSRALASVWVPPTPTCFINRV